MMDGLNNVLYQKRKQVNHCFQYISLAVSLVTENFTVNLPVLKGNQATQTFRDTYCLHDNGAVPPCRPPLMPASGCHPVSRTERGGSPCG